MKIRLEKGIKIIVLTIMYIIAFSVMNFSNAAIDFAKAEKFISEGQEQSALSQESINEIGGDFSEVGGILTYIGAAVLVGAMAYIGILYMISPPDKQAKLKQQLIGLAVSAIVIFGAYSIWSIIYNLLANTFGN